MARIWLVLFVSLVIAVAAAVPEREKRQDITNGNAQSQSDVGAGSLLGGLLGRDRGGLTINLGGLTRGLSPLASGALGLASGVAGGVKDGLIGLGSGVISGSGSFLYYLMDIVFGLLGGGRNHRN